MTTIIDGLTFDDILLQPKFSEIKSRSEVDLSVKLPKGFSFKTPIIPANMSDIISEKMIIKMYEMGSMSIMHRFCSFEEQIKLIRSLSKKYNDIFNYVGVSVGVKPEDLHSVSMFSDLGIRIICIDVAHLDSILGLSMIEHIAKKYPHILLIVGNVATGAAAARAWRSGADIVKVGIGASGICSTRLETGNGVPQLSAIMNVYQQKEALQNELKRRLYFISDGGHKKTADIVKALCFADLVMLGGMLAGTDETNAMTVEVGSEKFVSYNGSSTHKKDRVEGVKGLVKPKGPVEDVIKKILQGIQSGASYQNSRNLQYLKMAPTFIRITNAGLVESNIHGVIVKDE
jgi:IMP dehydrogenase